MYSFTCPKEQPGYVEMLRYCLRMFVQYEAPAHLWSCLANVVLKAVPTFKAVFDIGAAVVKCPFHYVGLIATCAFFLQTAHSLPWYVAHSLIISGGTWTLSRCVSHCASFYTGQLSILFIWISGWGDRCAQLASMTFGWGISMIAPKPKLWLMWVCIKVFHQIQWALMQHYLRCFQGHPRICWHTCHACVVYP